MTTEPPFTGHPADQRFTRMDQVGPYGETKGTASGASGAAGEVGEAAIRDISLTSLVDRLEGLHHLIANHGANLEATSDRLNAMPRPEPKNDPTKAPINGILEAAHLIIDAIQDVVSRAMEENRRIDQLLGK